MTKQKAIDKYMSMLNKSKFESDEEYNLRIVEQRAYLKKHVGRSSWACPSCGHRKWFYNINDVDATENYEYNHLCVKCNYAFVIAEDVVKE